MKSRYEIKTVSIIGLGALGVLFGYHLSQRMPKKSLRIIADRERIEKYLRDGIYCNGKLCDFQYVTPEAICKPADLLLFTVKEQGLEQAISAVKNQVGENTIILSALNGIISEEIIGKVYGLDKLLYCVAQGMDTVKEGNQLNYSNLGILAFGDQKGDIISEKSQAVASFFEHTGLPHLVDINMRKRMWGKFMLNVGVNQTVAVIDGTYGDIQKEGKAREQMIAAMREVITLSEREGIDLKEEDLNYWLNILGTLNPEGKPSMRQDMEAKRYSEVELFSGTVLKLAKKYGISMPVNEDLYAVVKERESHYNNIV